MALPVVRTVRYAPAVRSYDRQFDQLVRTFLAPRPAVQRRWAPVTEVDSTEAAYTVTVELPGVKREGVTVEVADKTLVVTATKGQEQPAEEPTAEGSEGEQPEPPQATGPSFTLRRSLPADVHGDDVTATLADGVLTVTLPRAAAPAPRKVEIAQG